MLLYIDSQVRDKEPKNRAELLEAINHGAVMRVRPKLMTVLTILIGLAPVFLSDGLGADVMRRIALPMIGGIISTLVLSLLVIPAVYYLWVSREFNEPL